MLVYNPKLDILRSFAVLGVILTHWINAYLGNKSITYLYFGGHGVEVFFCLSGFLITYILLTSKYNSSGDSIGAILKTFYIRRTLRIFPIYYLFLFLLLVAFGNYVFMGDFLYFVFYVSNIKNFLDQDLGSKMINHLWSLAVEEQFYLIWPFLILLLPRKKELYAIIFLLVLGAMSYYILKYNGFKQVNRLTFVNFDFLCSGALLAYLKFFNVLNKRIKIEYVLSVLIISFFMAFNDIGRFERIWLLIFSTALIFSLAFYDNKPIASYWKPLIYIGKISYGLYLYHKPIPFVTDLVITKLGTSPDNYSDWLRFSIYFIVLLISASLSWFVVEKPILKLKSRYSY